MYNNDSASGGGDSKDSKVIPIHVIRMFKERTWLENNLEALRNVIEGDHYKRLPEDEKARILTQEMHMEEYRKVLVKRIRAAGY